jgi:hypothetical protein
MVKIGIQETVIKLQFIKKLIYFKNYINLKNK